MLRLVVAATLALGACQNGAPSRHSATREGQAPPEPQPHPIASAEAPARLPPLRADWMVALSEGDVRIVVMPPTSATAPARLVIGVHGAGDRPDWACGGWRLGAQVSAFVACPEGHPMGAKTFGWVSPRQVEERALAALRAVTARYGAYVSAEPAIFAGFSQGATYAEPLLREHARLFPIALFAEGGYRTISSPSFAAAYRASGGRRVVIVCGTPSCFTSARAASKVLERAELETLVVGDERAGHNLNERMQRALQGAWPRITAPLR
jgi:predicted esterase